MAVEVYEIITALLVYYQHHYLAFLRFTNYHELIVLSIQQWLLLVELLLLGVVFRVFHYYAALLNYILYIFKTKGIYI